MSEFDVPVINAAALVATFVTAFVTVFTALVADTSGAALVTEASVVLGAETGAGTGTTL
jgi:hypothetical protein